MINKFFCCFYCKKKKKEKYIYIDKKSNYTNTNIDVEYIPNINKIKKENQDKYLDKISNVPYISNDLKNIMDNALLKDYNDFKIIFDKIGSSILLEYNIITKINNENLFISDKEKKLRYFFDIRHI